MLNVITLFFQLNELEGVCHDSRKSIFDIIDISRVTAFFKFLLGLKLSRHQNAKS